MCVILTATDCEGWAFLQYVGVRTSPFLKLRNPNKKLKSHNFVIGTYIFPPRLFRFFSLRDISAVLSATMSIFSATCSVYPALSKVELFDMGGVN